MRREGSSDTFSLPQTVKEGNTTTRYVYREDLTLENKTTYYSSGEYRVCEYDEKGVLQTDVLYDADGRVIAQYYPKGK